MAAMVLRKNRPSSLIALLLMTPDTPIIPFLPVLDALDLTSNEVLMEEKALRLPIMTNNWPAQYGYMPLTCVNLAYTDTGLYLRFYSRGRGLKATISEDGGRVHLDSCVEAFLRMPGEDRYYNFEFNCIGACDASHRLSREESEPLTSADYLEIRRAASERRDTVFEQRQGIQSFWVSVKVSWRILGLIRSSQIPDHIEGNFYKCGDETVIPHFASWQPIHSAEPDFHRPESFARLNLASRD